MNMLFALVLVGCGEKSVSLDTQGDSAEVEQDSATVVQDCEDDDNHPEFEQIEPDCDHNGIEDSEDLEEPATMDCNSNGVPDRCETLEEGCTHWGQNQYVQYDVGTLPIILSAPHGGQLEPDEIPVRAGATSGSDLYTIELAQAIQAGLLARTGRSAHLVACHLHRWRLDCNRDIEEAAEGNPLAEQAWYEYHRYIDAAKEAVFFSSGRGLFVDVHGLAASRDKIELGYLFTGSQLLADDTRMAHDAYPALSSLKSLAEATDTPFPEVIRGAQSLGGLLETAGYAVVPSPGHPDPGLDGEGEVNDYFSGGYNTRRHGSYGFGPVSSVQLESVWEGVRDTAEHREAFGLAMADALLEFMGAHMDLDPSAASRVGLVVDLGMVSEDGEEKEVRLVRYGSTAQPMSVTLELGGTAEAGVDYVAPETTFTLEAGETEVVFEIQPIDDDEVEGSETVALKLVATDGTNLGDLSEVVLQLADDEQFSTWLEWVSIVVEGEPGVIFEVVRDGCGVEFEVELEYAGTASVADFESLPSAVTLEPLQRRSAVFLNPLADGKVEGRERLDVSVAETSQPGVWNQQLIAVWDGDLDNDLVRWWRMLFLEDHVEEGVIRSLGHSYPSTGPAMPIEASVSETFPALSFDGVDDVVLLEDPSTDVNDPLTVSLAFRADSTSSEGYQYIFSHGTVTYANSLNLYLNSSGTLRTGIRGVDDAWDYDALDVAGDFRDDTWHHWSVVVENGQTVVAVDGVVVSQGPLGVGGLSPGRRIAVGGRGDLQADRHFAGDIADVRIYRRALDAAELAALAAPFLTSQR
jgi:hypothetical protein